MVTNVPALAVGSASIACELRPGALRRGTSGSGWQLFVAGLAAMAMLRAMGLGPAVLDSLWAIGGWACVVMAFKCSLRAPPVVTPASVRPLQDGGPPDQFRHLHAHKLRSSLREVIGRRIDAIILSERRDGRYQLYITLDDNTHYEFYGTGHLSGTRGVHRGGRDSVLNVIRRSRCVFEVIDEARGSTL